MRMAIRMSSEPGINALRFLLMFTVVLAHAWFFIGSIAPDDPAYYLLITAQCSVPAFFIISGYFLRWREGDVFAVTRWACTKLLPLYVLWVAIYVVAAWLAGIGSLRGLVVSFVHGGPVRHLWFLPALAVALSLTSLSLRLIGPRATWVAAIALAAFGLFTGTYQLALGIDTHPIRGGILTAPLLVLFGTAIAAREVPRAPLLFGGAAVVTYLFQCYDDRLVASFSNYSALGHWSMTLATFPFALSMFLFARSLPHSRLINGIAGRKNHLLILYCIHPMIITVISWSWHWRGLSSVLLVTTLAYVLSLLCAGGFAALQRCLRELPPRAHLGGATAISRG
jgi:surface polysaccharide O-acyltransferase-like enzyme